MPLLVSDAFEIAPEGLTFTEKNADTVKISEVKWTALVQGNVVQFARTGCFKPEHIKHERGAIGPWSQQSRMKMLRFLNRIDYARIGPSLFLTLTYPDRAMKIPYKQRTMQRSVFMRHIETHLGQRVPSIWRVEWEERKSGQYTGNLAPHFHLMLFGVQWLPWQRVRNWWRRSIQAGKGPLVTEVKRIYNEDGACRYLSKYVSKYRSLDISSYLNSGLEFGRHWGVTRRELIPLCPVTVERELTADEVERVRAFAVARWRWYDPQTCGGFTLLSPHLAKSFAAFLLSSGRRASRSL